MPWRCGERSAALQSRSGHGRSDALRLRRVALRRCSQPNLDMPTFFLFPPPVPLMPNMIVKTSATRCQGHTSIWRAVRAPGIVKETF